MSVQYQAGGWNRQKRFYDFVLASSVLTYLALFVGVGAILHPNATAETLLIRGFGTALPRPTGYESLPNSARRVLASL